MAAEPYSPRWVWWGPADARSELRVLKAHVYDPSGSSARVIWSLEHVCRAIPTAPQGRVTKWLQRAGAPSCRCKFCLQHGLRECDWLPSLLSNAGQDAATHDRSLRAGNDARCGTRYLLALLLMWSHKLRKGKGGRRPPSASSRTYCGKWKAACLTGSSRWLNGRRGRAPLAEIRHRRSPAAATLNRSRRNPSGSLSAQTAGPTPRTWRR